MSQNHGGNILGDESSLEIEVNRHRHYSSVDRVVIDEASLVALDRGQNQFVAVSSNIGDNSLSLDGTLVSRSGSRISHNDDINHSNHVQYDGIDYVTLTNEHHGKFTENIVPVSSVDFVEMGDNALKGTNGAPLELYFDVMTNPNGNQSTPYLPRHEHQTPKAQLLVRAYTDFMQTQDDHQNHSLSQELQVHMNENENNNPDSILPHVLEESLLPIEQAVLSGTVNDFKKSGKMELHKRHIQLQFQAPKQEQHELNTGSIVLQQNHPNSQDNVLNHSNSLHDPLQLSSTNNISHEKVFQSSQPQHVEDELVFPTSQPQQRYVLYHKPFSTNSSFEYEKDDLIPENMMQYPTSQTRLKQTGSSEVYVTKSLENSEVNTSQSIKMENDSFLPLVSRSGRPIRRRPEYIEYVSQSAKDDAENDLATLKLERPRLRPLEEEENYNEEFIESYDEDMDQNATYSSDGRKSLPHKKRIPKKLKTSKKNVKMYKCGECGEQFTNVNLYNQHSHAVASKSTVFSCEICAKNFDSQLNFFEHLKTHYEPTKKYKCEICDSEFLSSELLQEHSLVHTREPFQCAECHKTFRKQSMLEVHEKDVHFKNSALDSVKIFSCPVCCKGHLSQASLDVHIKNDHEFNCEDCFKVFQSKNKLMAHCKLEHKNNEISPKKNSPKKVKTRHAKKGEFFCTHCPRSFQHKNSLLYHIRGHTGERPHQCDQCGKAFFAGSALKVHLRMHSGEKPYKCSQCDKYFRQYGDLRYHTTSVHSDERLFQCEFCGKDFKRKYCLVVHRRIHTGEKKYKCEYCNKRFRASSYLQNHIRIHTGERPFPCPDCGKPFRVRSDMRRHRNTHLRDSANLNANAVNVSVPGSLNSQINASTSNTTNNNFGNSPILIYSTSSTPTAQSVAVSNNGGAGRSEPRTQNFQTNDSVTHPSNFAATETHALITRPSNQLQLGNLIITDSVPALVSGGDQTPPLRIMVSNLGQEDLIQTAQHPPPAHQRPHMSSLSGATNAFTSDSPRSNASLPSDGELFLDENSSSCSSQPMNLNILPRMIHPAPLTVSGTNADVTATEFQLIPNARTNLDERDDGDVCVWTGLKVFTG